MKFNILQLFKKFFFETTILILIVFMYKNYMVDWVKEWSDIDSFYGFGFLLLGFFAYLLKENFEKIKNMEKFQNPWGIAIIIPALILYIFGYRASIHYLVNISFPVLISGIILTFYGNKLFKITLLPLFLFSFATPIIPLFRLTMMLQLLSAKLSAKLLSILGLAAYNEGSIVTVNNYKLAVVAGCSGLKSLSTLMFTAIMSCYFCNIKLLKKIFVVLFCIPLAVIMNTIRISTVGFYVIYNGYEGMEKFHDNLGIFIFLISLGIIILLIKTFEDSQESQKYEI